MMRSSLPLLAMLVLVGCPELDGSRRDSGTTPPAGGCTEDTAPWFVECPDSLEVFPAQMLGLTVQRMNLVAPEVFLWVEGDDEAYPIHGIGELPPDPADPTAATRHLLSFPLPKLAEGIYRVSIGSEMGIRSNSIDLRLVHPVRRYTQQEVAALLESSYGHLASDVQAVFNSPEPEWQQTLDEVYDSDMRATIAAEFEISRELGRTLGANYMELSEDDERLLQAALEGSGVLESLDLLESGSSHLPDRVPLLHDFGQVTAHRVALQLDSFSTAIDLLGIALDAITVVSLLSGVGAPAAGLSAGARVSIAFIKGIIDTFLPTDLIALEVQIDDTQHHLRSARMVPWGTFRPQNGAGGGARAVGDVIAEMLSSVVPVKRGQIIELGVNFLNSVIIRLGFSATYMSDRLDDSRIDSLIFKAPVDMQAYSISLGAILMRTPIIGPKLADTLWFLNAISLRDSVRLSGGVPAAWFEDASVDLSSWDILSIDDARFPGTAPFDTGAAIIELNAFALETRKTPLMNLPRLRWVSVVPDAITVRSVADPGDPNDRNDILDHIFYTHTSGTRPSFGLSPITRGTEAARTYSMRIWHVGGFVGAPSVNIEVNGSPLGPTTPGRFFTGREATPVIALSLRPGKNEVRVINENPMVTSCSVGGVTASGSGCLIVRFDEASDVDPQHTLFMGQTPDGSYTFTVWTPPAFE